MQRLRTTGDPSTFRPPLVSRHRPAHQPLQLRPDETPLLGNRGVAGVCPDDSVGSGRRAFERRRTASHCETCLRLRHQKRLGGRRAEDRDAAEECQAKKLRHQTHADISRSCEPPGRRRDTQPCSLVSQIVTKTNAACKEFRTTAPARGARGQRRSGSNHRAATVRREPRPKLTTFRRQRSTCREAMNRSSRPRPVIARSPRVGALRRPRTGSAVPAPGSGLRPARGQAPAVGASR